MDGTNGYFPTSIRYTNYNQPNSSLNPYSVVNGFNFTNHTIYDGSYQFRLVYNDGDVLSDGITTFDEIWTQKSWLTDGDIVGSSLGSPSSDCNAVFYGLGMSFGNGGYTNYTFLDGNDDYGCWHYAVGLILADNGYGGLAPVTSIYALASSMDLYVCDGAYCNSNSDIQS